MENLKKVSKKLKKVFSKVEIKECSMCGAYISKKEFDECEGVCAKHWIDEK